MLINDVIIRKITVDDAENYLDLLIKLDSESHFLHYESGEREYNLAKVEKYLIKILDTSSKSTVFVAANKLGQLIGQVSGDIHNSNKRSHCMTVSLSVLKGYKGIGRPLAELIIAYSKEIGLKKIEFTVMEDNKICLNLCKKMGCHIEGIKKKSIKINNRYLDEYILGIIHE